MWDVHPQRSDRSGNVLIEGVAGVQKEVVLASQVALVTVEEVVDDLATPSLNSVILQHRRHCGGSPRCLAVLYPSFYERDNAFYLEWDGISRRRDTFLDWMGSHVLEQESSAYTASEMMTIRVRPTVGNDDVCFVGISTPSAA